jgi:hypothetical protein
MGILNTHQILKGARTPINSKPYVISGVKEKPTVTVTDTDAAVSKFALAGGVIELDGRDFSLNGLELNFGTTAGIATTVKLGARYLVCAVPTYVEPLDKAAAESAGVNYYVSKSEQLETIAHFFVPSAIEQAVLAQGGYQVLSNLVLKGSPTSAQINLFNQYSLELEKVTDPRFVGQLLRPSGVKFVLAETVDQSNASSADKLEELNEAEYNDLKSKVNLYSQRKVYTRAAAITRFETGGRLYRLDRDSVNYKIKRYSNQADAEADVSPEATVFPVTGATPFTTGADSTDFFAVFETYYPSFMPLGLQGNQPKVLNILTENDSSYLGRIDPIYMANNLESARWTRKPLAALTLYGDPTPLFEVKVKADAKRLDATFGTSGINAKFDMLVN